MQRQNLWNRQIRDMTQNKPNPNKTKEYLPQND